jgi:hypothetical protein
LSFLRQIDRAQLPSAIRHHREDRGADVRELGDKAHVTKVIKVRLTRLTSQSPSQRRKHHPEPAHLPTHRLVESEMAQPLGEFQMTLELR